MPARRKAEPELFIVVTKQKSAFAQAGKTEEMVKNASSALAKLGEALRKTGAGFIEAVKGAGPDEVQLELNLSLETEGRWLIVAGKAGATAGVTMTWKRQEG
jgi:NTP-dependent ternary system trypsin peptidase co-occuring protein